VTTVGRQIGVEATPWTRGGGVRERWIVGGDDHRAGRSPRQEPCPTRRTPGTASCARPPPVDADRLSSMASTPLARQRLSLTSAWAGRLPKVRSSSCAT